jgi:outer membrane receptor protein involved in Fe transport
LALGVSAQQLEEVVVTAQKRTESLQDVPISVTAISGQLIQDASIRSFSELSAYVPNFSVAENPVNTIITMRGISIGSNQSFEQSVGLFLDGVYLGRSRQSRIGLFDLEQVEVLRGPQGNSVWKKYACRGDQRALCCARSGRAPFWTYRCQF